MKLRILAIATMLVAAGCAGGGGTSAPVPKSPTPTDSPTKSPTVQTVKFRFVIPARTSKKTHGAHPHFVSPSTTQLEVDVNSVNGGAVPPYVTATTVTQLTTTGPTPPCTLSGGTETCTVAVEAPVGTVNYTFIASDGTNVLSAFQGDQTIVQGQTNSLAITLEGLVRTVAVSVPSSLTPLAAKGSTPQTLTVNAYDADANLIVSPGPYANPITVTDPETSTSGATGLSLNGAADANSVVVTAPTDVVTLDYTGQAINSFTMGVGGSIPGGGTIACDGATLCNLTAATPNDITFAGTKDDTASNGGLAADPNFGQQTAYFLQASGTAIVTGSEVGFTGGGFTGTFDIALDQATCGSGATAVASTTAGPATTFTITALKAGICKAQLTEHGAGYPLTDPGHTPDTAGSPTHGGVFWISVTSNGIGINSRTR